MKKSSTTTLPYRLLRIIELGREDPVIFANYLLGMPLHRGQVKYLRDTFKLKRKINILVPSNRYGKSSLGAILHIHAHFYKLGIPRGSSSAWTRADYRTANIAPLAPLVEPIFNYIDQIMSSRYLIRLPDGSTTSNKCLIEWFYLSERTTTKPVMRQYFAFNSYVEHRTIGATAADSLEGKPWGLITYDEGGRSGHLEQEINGTLLARLFDWEGSLHILSTPDQTSASILYHYKLYQDGLLGINRTYTMEGALRDNTFFPESQINEQYELYKDNPLREQVLEGKFVFGGDNIFRAPDILEAIDDSLKDGIRYEENHQYVFGTDTAIGSDEFVTTCLDNTSDIKRLVRLQACKGNSKAPQRHLNDFLDLIESYSNPDKSNFKHMLETWNGESVRFYHDLPYWVQVKTKCYGSWQPDLRTSDNMNKLKPRTNIIKKADIIISLQKLLSSKKIKIPNDPDLVQQLSIYREDDKNIPTDRVISLGLACWLATEGKDFQSDKLAFLSW